MKFNEILNEAKKRIENGENLTRYYRSNVLNQAKGLTDFIKEIEKKAENEFAYFEIVECNIKDVIPCVEKTKNFFEHETIFFENEKELLIKDYVGFIYNDYYYYFQIDDNPFFNHYYSKVKLSKDEKGFFYEANCYLNKMKIFDSLDSEKLFGHNQEARKQIKDRLLNFFKNLKHVDSKHVDSKHIDSKHIVRINPHIFYGI